MIVDALRGAGRPVSAYEIIDQLRGKATLAPADRLSCPRPADCLGLRAPPRDAQCLRGLRALPHTGAAVFAICDSCGTVTEFEEPRAVAALAAWAKKAKFQTRAMTLELRGRCAACAIPPR